MKKVIVLSAVVLSSLVFGYSAQAQVRFNVNINIGSQPAWVVNQDQADYYYIPDADCYYSVREKVYVVHEGNNWRRMQQLPPRFRNFDFRNRRVISIRGQQAPYMHHDENRMAYARANDRFNDHGHDNRFDRRDNDRHDNDRRGNDHRDDDRRNDNRRDRRS